MYRILPLIVLLFSCGETEHNSEQIESKIGGFEAEIETIEPAKLIDSITQELTTSDHSFSHKIIQGEHGWGYEIYEGETMMIRQLHIPSVPGINGFETEEKATIAADYILNEVANGNFPPTVNKDILDSLQVL